MKKILLIVATVTISIITYSQTPEDKLKEKGNCIKYPRQTSGKLCKCGSRRQSFIPRG